MLRYVYKMPRNKGLSSTQDDTGICWAWASIVGFEIYPRSVAHSFLDVSRSGDVLCGSVLCSTVRCERCMSSCTYALHWSLRMFRTPRFWKRLRRLWKCNEVHIVGCMCIALHHAVLAPLWRTLHNKLMRLKRTVSGLGSWLPSNPIWILVIHVLSNCRKGTRFGADLRPKVSWRDVDSTTILRWHFARLVWRIQKVLLLARSSSSFPLPRSLHIWWRRSLVPVIVHVTQNSALWTGATRGTTTRFWLRRF